MSTKPNEGHRERRKQRLLGGRKRFGFTSPSGGGDVRYVVKERRGMAAATAHVRHRL